MDKLVLFDIDGTLVGGPIKAEWLAYAESVRSVYGVDFEPSRSAYHGITTPQIITESLKKLGLDNVYIKSKLGECLEVMGEVFKKAIVDEKVAVLPGVYGLLNILTQRQVLIGLVTGNPEPIAKAKLEQAGLVQFFKVGGFGSDSIDRTELIKLAIERANKNLNFFKTGSVYYIGDAEADVTAGKNAGIKTIGVTTSGFSPEQLITAGASFVLNDLSDIDKVLNILSL